MAAVQKFFRQLSTRKPKKGGKKSKDDAPKDDRPTAASAAAMATSFPTATESAPAAAAVSYNNTRMDTGFSASAAVLNQKDAKPFVLGSQDFQMDTLPGRQEWTYDNITLQRTDKGLGFNIGGGTDSGGDGGIFVTKIREGGVAAADGRLRLNDVIVSVNGTAYAGLTHQESVEVLRDSGTTVCLAIKRFKKPIQNDEFEVDLVKNGKGLGFNVAGGSDDQYIEGDAGIFITKIGEGGAAYIDGKLSVGDRLLSVNDVNLVNVKHAQAVSILKATPEQVHLVVRKENAVNNTRVENRCDPAPVHVSRSEMSITIATRAVAAPVVKLVAPAMPPPGPPVMPPPSVVPAPPVQNSTFFPPPSNVAPTPVASNNLPQLVPLVVGQGDQIPNFIQEPRMVTLKKKPNAGLGFNIVGGKDRAGIFISSVLLGSVADENGKLRRGDQILSVNGVDLRRATHEEAAAALKAVGDTALIHAQYRIEEFNHLEQRIREWHAKVAVEQGAVGLPGLPVLLRTVMIRVLVDYDANMDLSIPRGKGLSVSFGDILHVSIPNDGSDWWQVRRILPPPALTGLIPSIQKMEEREAAKPRLVKSGSTIGDSREIIAKDKNRRSFYLSKKMSFSRMNSKSKKEDTDGSVAWECPVLYQPVVQTQCKYTRPVMIFGPIKDRINNDLVSDFPQNYSSCVPHTTRPIRRGEMDGVDYHFVQSREQMERDLANNVFVEAGVYGDHLYGMSVESVMSVAQQGKHCIMDVSVNAIPRLVAAELHPITILIKPASAMAVGLLSRPISDDVARQVFAATTKLYEESRHYFTAVVTGDTIDEIYRKIKQVIVEQSQPQIWVNSNESLKMT